MSNPRTKTCRRCGAEKPADHFPWDRARPDHRHPYCLPCKRDDQRRRRAEHPEQRARNRRDNLRRKYGITPEAYDAMLAAQGGRCAVCLGADPQNEYGRMLVDHDHATGQVRQLLCGPCNRGLGAFRDDPNRLLAAAAYVHRHALT